MRGDRTCEVGAKEGGGGAHIVGLELAGEGSIGELVVDAVPDEGRQGK